MIHCCSQCVRFYDVLVKLFVNLLTPAIIALLLFSYKKWWPRLKGLLAGLRLGGAKRLDGLRKLISRYENFTRIEELESSSKVHRNFANAFHMAVLTFFLSMPLIIGFVTLLDEAIVVDVVVNLKPGATVPKYPHGIFWGARIYGGVLGIGIALLLHFLEQASIAASDLSLAYREERLGVWRKTRDKLEAKLGQKSIGAGA